MAKQRWQAWMQDKKQCKKWLDKYAKEGVLLKSIDESKLQVKRAYNNLNFANWLFDEHKADIPNFFGKETFYERVAHNYYSATYHAALALINRKGYISNSNSSTLCFLIYYYHHLEKVLEKEELQAEKELFLLNEGDIKEIVGVMELNEKANDIHSVFDEKSANSIKENAVAFINKVNLLLGYV